MLGKFKSPPARGVRAAITTLPVALADDDHALVRTDWDAAMAWFLANATRAGHSPSSIDMRRQRFLAFSCWAEPYGLTPESVTPSHVKQFVDHCQARNNSNFTINGKLRVVKTFYNEAMTDGLLPTNPAANVRRLREATNTVIPLTATEVKTLLSSFRLNDWVELRDYVITVLILDSGLRATEALRVKVEDVRLTEGAVFIPPANAKGAKARTVYVGTATVRLIKEWLDKRGTPCDWLFPAVYVDIAGGYTPLTRKAYYKRLVKYGQKAGILHIHPHQLRHTYAISYLVNSGGDLVTAARQLGHSSLKVTERYLNVAESNAQKTLAQQHSLIDQIDKSNAKRTRGITTRRLGGNDKGGKSS